MFICLVLDKDCRVLKAIPLKAESLAQAAALAMRENERMKGWGFELWRAGKMLRSSYDCHAPPARVMSRYSSRPRMVSP